MPKGVIDADGILNQAKPLVHQQAHEIQPFGHLVKLPIALAANVCKEGVDHLNQLLADTITLRDLCKKHHWQVAGPTFYQLHLARSASSAFSPTCCSRGPARSRPVATWTAAHDRRHRPRHATIRRLIKEMITVAGPGRLTTHSRRSARHRDLAFTRGAVWFGLRRPSA